MTKRQLGNSDLQITTIGLGTFAMGGEGWQASWGPVDDAESVQTIRAACEAGVNWLDTAAVYGFGHSESVVGQAIKGMAQRPLIFTKCGRRWEAGSPKILPNLDPVSIRRECDESLQRLGVDVIDLYQIHWPQPDEGVEAAWSVVVELIKAGKVRYGGVSNFSVDQLRRCQRIHPVTSLQPPYNLMKREIEADILPFCREHNIGIITHSTMAQGFLTGKVTAEWVAALPETDHRKRSERFREPQLSQHNARIDRLRRIADAKGVTVAHLAIAWVIAQPGVTGAIVGARRSEQIRDTARAAAVELTAQELEEIRGIYA